MNDNYPLEFRRRFHEGRRGRSVELRIGERPEAPPPGSVPRVARLLALAHHYRSMVDRGEVRDYADIAGLVGVTRARVTQIMDLLLLAPDIQEAVLDLPRIRSGRDRTGEREVRMIAHVLDWSKQRERWTQLAGVSRFPFPTIV